VKSAISFSSSARLAVVSKSGNKAAAQEWIKGILSDKGQTAMKSYGFLPLPKASS
jgi:ABC-type molybdate transport system substrate-binding protein